MSTEQDEPVELTPSHHFEFLDRVHIAEAYVEMSLGNHPMLAHYPSLRARYEEVVGQLAAMYQEIGQLDDTWK